MNILYIAPFATNKYLRNNGDTNPGSIAGNIKVESIARTLASQGNNVTILSSIMTTQTQFRVAPSVVEYLDDQKRIKIIYPTVLKIRPLGGLLNCILAPYIIKKIYLNERPEFAIIYNTYLFETIATAYLKVAHKTKYWLEIEDLPLARQRGIFNVKPLLDSLCWKWAVKNAAAITAVNSIIYKKLPTYTRKYLLPGIVSDELIKKSLLREEPFTKRQKFVGYFGGLIDRKGVRVLIEAVKNLPENWKMIVGGGGPMSTEFENVAREFPNKLSFTGGWSMSNEQIYDLMCVCDALVIPKEQISNNGEGVFPFKTFEYVISGAHLISAKLPLLDNYKCEFFQRWDGVSATSLNMHLNNSYNDFHNEKYFRESLRKEIIKRVSQEAVAILANSIVEASY